MILCCTKFLLIVAVSSSLFNQSSQFIKIVYCFWCLLLNQNAIHLNFFFVSSYRKRIYMKLRFHWDSLLLWVLECMGWLAGLTYCLMGGNLLNLLNNLYFYICTGQHCSKFSSLCMYVGSICLICFLELLWSAVLYKDGLPLPLVHQPRTGTNYVVSSLSQFMSWRDKKLLANSAWLPIMLRVIHYILHWWVCFCLTVFVFVLLICFSGNLTSYSSTAKMWGPGAEQGGIIQASSCKLDLKEPYYRMSQPQAYPLAQDQQSHPLINTQVLLVITFELSFYMSLVHWHSWQLFPQKFWTQALVVSPPLPHIGVFPVRSSLCTLILTYSVFCIEENGNQ